MCEYCDKGLFDDGKQKSIVDEEIDAGIFGNLNLMADVFFDRKERWVLSIGWLGEGDAGFFHDSSINYCPMCGRKLEEDDSAGKGEEHETQKQ